MAIITDPDDLTYEIAGVPSGSQMITLDTTTLEVTLSVVGALTTDGVTLQALYSKFKEIWKSDATLIKYAFPMEAITGEQFEFINGWVPDVDATRKLIRSGGWAEKTSVGVVTREYMGVVTLGSIDSTHTVYYAWASDTNKTDFTYSGPVNEAVQIYGDVSNGAFDNRSVVLTVANRPDPDATPQGWVFDKSTTTAIGASTVTYQVYRFPLGESSDLKVNIADISIDATADSVADVAPFTDMSIDYYATPQSRNIGGTPYDFHVVINGNDATAEQIYQFVQWSLRQDVDIDALAGTVNGYLADPLLVFVGDTLKTVRQSDGGGVYIDGYNTNDTNRIKFVDDLGIERSEPFVAAGNIAFNNNLIDDASTKYVMFYTTNPAGNFGTSTATIVENNSAVAIDGDLHYQLATPTSGANTNTNGSAAAGGFVLTSAAAGWTVSDFDGKVLVVTSGLNVGYYWIETSDATTITVANAFEATDAAMTFEIRNKNTTGLISFDYDYDNNIQGGRTGGTDAGVTVVALGLRSAQYVSTTYTISATVGQNIALVAALERNYSDPV
jgi:hypothetical protein